MRKAILLLCLALLVPMVSSGQSPSINYYPAGGGGESDGLIFDEFVSGGPSTATVGSLGWSYTCAGGSAAATSSEANRAGIFRLTAAAAANCSVYVGGAVGSGILAGSQTATYRFIVRANTAANVPKRRVGLNTAVTTDGAGDGVYFEALTDGNWFAVTNNGAGEKRVDTGVALNAASWVSLGITFTAGVSAASFYIDGVLVSSAQSDNFPAATVIIPYVQYYTTGSAAVIDIDYFEMVLPAK